MSSFPAHTFTNTNNPSTNNRLSQMTSWGSPLYIIHKDVTKTLESPNSINEIIDGTETEAQYSVILDVPNGARGFIPFWVLNATFSASTAYFNEAKVTVTVGAGTNPLRFFFHARTPTWESDKMYTPFSAAMTSAPDPSTYGYWHNVAAIRMSSSTTGSDNFIMYGDANNASAGPAGYSLPVASANALTRTFIVPAHNARASGVGLENLVGTTVYTATAATTPFNSDAGTIPLFGCDKLTCFGAHSGTAPTIAVGANMGSGTISNISVGIGVRFVS